MCSRVFLIRLSISISACILLLWWVNWPEFGQTLRAANVYWLGLVFIMMHLDRSFMAYKWLILLRGLGIAVSARAVLRAYYIGFFWSSFLPSVGGDLVRAGALMKEVQHRSEIIASMIIERLLGFLALSMIAAGNFFVLGRYTSLKLPELSELVVMLLVISMIAIAILFSQHAHHIVGKLITYLSLPSISRFMEKIRLATFAFKEKPWLLLVFLALSIVEQAFPIGAVFLLAKALAIDLPLVWAMFGVPAVLTVSRMPISVNGLGIQEGAYAFIFSFAGISLSEVVVMSITDRILLLLAALPGAWWTVYGAKSQGLSQPWRKVPISQK